MMPMQIGDVTETWADVSLLEALTGLVQHTNINQGIKNFIHWYKEYYGI